MLLSLTVEVGEVLVDEVSLSVLHLSECPISQGETPLCFSDQLLLQLLN